MGGSVQGPSWTAGRGLGRGLELPISGLPRSPHYNMPRPPVRAAVKIAEGYEVIITLRSSNARWDSCARLVRCFNWAVSEGAK